MIQTARTARQLTWIVDPPHAQRAAFARQAHVAAFVAQLLLNRGITDVELAQRFLNPEFRQLLAPSALPGAVEAGQRLADAARTQKRIVIYGDYDVDGVTATTILWHVLRRMQARVEYYIPSRMDEGYGLNADALERVAADGPALVVTVDCGITALAEAERARALGLELIITDHHQPRATLPRADVLVHPTALGASANPDLSGAGVALKVAWAAAQAWCGAERLPPPLRECLIEATTFAALGLVADIVPLTGENRVIAAFGLRGLKQPRNPGLAALIEVAGLSGKQRYDDYDVGFLLAPRLNAVGRLGHARLAVELFTRADADAAAQIAQTLDGHNRQRQALEREIAKQAEALVLERGFHRDACRGIVLASVDWHPGVIGIVASRLVDRFCRPTVLIALENGLGQGSGRSVRHFPLHEALAACEPHLLSHGGHAMAAGVKLRTDQLEAFTDAFLAQAAQRLTPADLEPKLRLDDCVDLAELDVDAVALLEKFAPFGPGNPRPRLATEMLEIYDEPRVLGAAGKHLQFTVRSGRTFRRVIAFNRGKQLEQFREQRRLRIAFEPMLNEWNGRRSVELKLVDCKFE